MRVAFATSGCRLNQFESDALEDMARKAGHEVVAQDAAPELVVVNTCTVTAEADQDARQAIRRIRRENPEAEILVTGCYAQRSPETLSQIDGVKWVVGNSHKTLIGDVLAPEPKPADAKPPETGGPFRQEPDLVQELVSGITASGHWIDEGPRDQLVDGIYLEGEEVPVPAAGSGRRGAWQERISVARPVLMTQRAGT